MISHTQVEAFERFVKDTFDVSRTKAHEAGQMIADLIARTPSLSQIQISSNLTSDGVDTALKQIGTVMVPAIYIPVGGALATMFGLMAFTSATPLLIAICTIAVFAMLALRFSKPLVENWIQHALEPIRGAL